MTVLAFAPRTKLYLSVFMPSIGEDWTKAVTLDELLFL
jgi:hypothetical protein